MYVEAVQLRSLIDLRIFRCPCHANDLREDATVPPAQETTNEHEHAPGADRKQRHP